MDNERAHEIIVKKILTAKRWAPAEILTRRHALARELKINMPSTAALRRAYWRLVKNKTVAPQPSFAAALKKRAVRTQSGVAIITVLTKPFPCPGRCVYCPSEARMPKSYLASEPAAQRALLNHFDPYEQVWTRLTTLRANGHPTDKIELIVKGGTWSAYTSEYQQWFIQRCFAACNDFHSGRHNHTTEKTSLITTQTRNETAGERIIGLTLETRPDWVHPKTIQQLRLLGCTRVELGLQHTDNKILSLVHRGHTVEQTMEAMRLLRQAGFKVDVHTMPQLPGTTPAKDFQMYKKLFSDERLRPDMIKIYPCVVLPSAELAAWHARGQYRPYAQKKLIALLVRVKTELLPYYCRISRLIRDIPSTEIVAGNPVTNLRETVQKIIRAQKQRCRCLRCREIGHITKEYPRLFQALARPKLFIEKYRASQGTEYFLSLEDKQRRAVLAFLRLYLPDATTDAATQKIHTLLPETRAAAFVRELHTYGFLVPIGEQGAAQQHRGLGKYLMREAERLATAAGYKKMTVISGVGVRGYYRLLGYRRQGTYMVKSL